MTVNKLILGDNMEILKVMDAESVDLIYLDLHEQVCVAMAGKTE
jgi:DNA modification methylase